MKPRAFFSQLDHDRMVAAIRQAEESTSGQIRVYVSHRRVTDAHRAAIQHFQQLGMTKTQQRNAVLIFVAPQSQQFAVVGDAGVHARCGQAFWDKLVTDMAAHFRADRFTDAVVQGIEAVGRELAQHFPPRASPRNELPDEVAGA